MNLVDGICTAVSISRDQGLSACLPAVITVVPDNRQMMLTQALKMGHELRSEIDSSIDSEFASASSMSLALDPSVMGRADKGYNTTFGFMSLYCQVPVLVAVARQQSTT